MICRYPAFVAKQHVDTMPVEFLVSHVAVDRHRRRSATDNDGSAIVRLQTTVQGVYDPFARGQSGFGRRIILVEIHNSVLYPGPSIAVQ